MNAKELDVGYVSNRDLENVVTFAKIDKVASLLSIPSQAQQHAEVLQNQVAELQSELHASRKENDELESKNLDLVQEIVELRRLNDDINKDFLTMGLTARVYARNTELCKPFIFESIFMKHTLRGHDEEEARQMAEEEYREMFCGGEVGLEEDDEDVASEEN